MVATDHPGSRILASLESEPLRCSIVLDVRLQSALLGRLSVLVLIFVTNSSFEDFVDHRRSEATIR